MAQHTTFSADRPYAANPQSDDADVAVATRPDPADDWREVEQANIMINPDPESMEDRG